jgi:hypothetical protein
MHACSQLGGPFGLPCPSGSLLPLGTAGHRPVKATLLIQVRFRGSGTTRRILSRSMLLYVGPVSGSVDQQSCFRRGVGCPGPPRHGFIPTSVGGVGSFEPAADSFWQTAPELARHMLQMQLASRCLARGLTVRPPTRRHHRHAAAFIEMLHRSSDTAASLMPAIHAAARKPPLGKSRPRAALGQRPITVGLCVEG